MNRIKRLDVLYHDRKVGTLAVYKEYLTAFEYDKDWLHDGFSISPFSLPLRSEVFIPRLQPFDGLFGVFADSLPDGWGRLLVDRLLRRHRIDPSRMNSLDRLAVVGSSGMGALTYHPEAFLSAGTPIADLDVLAAECRRLLQTDDSSRLDDLFRLGGSSGGARPKVLTQIDGEEWIIKFPSSCDSPDIGCQEYAYSLCARECGIEMEETRLFPSALCSGYFGTRRFDRHASGAESERLHMLSAGALLETSHRIPNLDYDTLMRLTLALTKDSAELLKLYRRMCFNVFAHNRDDHSKNFSYLYLEAEKRWRLSPAYDLTYSYSLNGEHATAIHGNGNAPGLYDLLAVAKDAGISAGTARRIASQVQECVSARLKEYLERQA